jgi:gliding motility-associated lipoprotein GldD
MKKAFLFCLVLVLLVGCQTEDSYLPRPRAFHRIELPKPVYQLLEGDYPYTFEHSKYAIVKPYQSRNAEPFWIELGYDSTTIASIHISYKSINNDPKLFEEYVNDAYKMTFNPLITAKATAIEQRQEQLEDGSGVLFTYSEGEVPTIFNFWVSDSTTHFFRAALYVPSSRDNDSLAPILKYTQEDMMHILKTFKWKK